MTQYNLTELINKPFHYLADSFGFSVVHSANHPQDYGNAIVVLASDSCRLRILLERERIFAEVGSLQAPLDWHVHAPNLWFDVGDVISFITGGSGKWQYPYLDSDPVGSISVADQLESISIQLRPYIGEILQLFEPGIFERQQLELIAHRKQQTDQWLDSLYRMRQ